MQPIYWIKYLDPIESLMSPLLSELAKPKLQYPTVWYKQSAFRKIRYEGEKSTIISRTKDGHMFYSGLIPRILQIADDLKAKVVFEKPQKFLIPKKEMTFPEGITPRQFQLDLINQALIAERGVLKAPTGTGKTILGLFLINSIDNLEQVLWLCHTKDLLYQTVEEAVKFFGYDSVGIIGDSKRDTGKFLTIATRQSFKELADDLGTSYDMVIVDETHHISKFKSDYVEILQKVFAPIRIGLTATVSTDIEARLAMEALIGPVVGEFTINKGIEEGFMAEIKIKIIKIPKLQRIRELRRYPDVYEQGVVRRLDRNKLIMDLVKDYTAQGKSCLIVVNQIEHGNLLLSMARNMGLDTEFIQGATDADARVLAKIALDKSHIKSVIATTVWKEGISIPSLNVVINAGGGKSEIATLQSIGRGTRTTPEKTEVIIHDFFDQSHPFLLDHFGERFCLYMNNQWIK